MLLNKDLKKNHTHTQNLEAKITAYKEMAREAKESKKEIQRLSQTEQLQNTWKKRQVT
jgi:hypothetical protein